MNVDFEFPEEINLNVELLKGEEYRFDLDVTPYAYNEDDYDWDLTGNDNVFSFDENTQTVTAIGKGSGTISLTIDGLTKVVDVKISSDELEVSHEDVVYIEKDTALLANNIFGYYHMGVSGLTGLVRVVGHDNQEFVEIYEFKLDTSVTTSYQLEYRLRSDVDFEKYLTYMTTVHVVDTELKDVVVHLASRRRANKVMFERQVEDETQFIYGGYLENYDTGHSPRVSLRAVALDSMSNMFLVGVDYLGIFDYESKFYDEWTYEGFELSSDIRLELSAAFDIKDQLYLAINNVIYLCEVDYDSKNVSVISTLTSVDDTVAYFDIAITSDGNTMYAIRSVSNNDEVTNELVEISLIDNSIVNTIELTPSDDSTYYGLAIKDNKVHLTGSDSYDGTVLSYVYDRNLNKLTTEGPMPYFFTQAVASSKGFDTEITSDDLTLDIGYGQSVANGEKQVVYRVLPETRQDFEVTYEIIQGNGIIELLDGGLVKGLKSGNAKVKITVDGVSAYSNVTVNSYSAPSTSSGPSVSVRITPDPITVEYGPGADESLLTAQAKASVSGTSNDSVTWSIRDDSVATVDSSGLVTAVKTGETTLTARTKYGNAVDTAKVVVYFIDGELDPLGLVEFNGAYLSGYPDKTFRPKNAITRAEIATMFTRLLNLEINTYDISSYSDLRTDHWAYTYIEAATNAGLLSGYENGEFRPDQPVSRAELAVIVAKYWQYFEYDVSMNPLMLDDVSPLHWARNYIYMMFNSGLIERNTQYRPEAYTLRDEIVLVLNALISRDALKTEDATFVDIDVNHPLKDEIEAASRATIKLQNDK
jgi:hypothetical protein